MPDKKKQLYSMPVSIKEKVMSTMNGSGSKHNIIHMLEND